MPKKKNTFLFSTLANARNWNVSLYRQIDVITFRKNYNNTFLNSNYEAIIRHRILIPSMINAFSNGDI